MSEKIYISSQHFCFSKYGHSLEEGNGKVCEHLQTCLSKMYSRDAAMRSYIILSHLDHIQPLGEEGGKEEVNTQHSPCP